MPLFPEEPNWDDLHGIPAERVAAEVWDTDGKILSKGEALIFPDNTTANFFPLDAAEPVAIQGRAKTLFLIAGGRSLSVSAKLCPDETPHEPHLHLDISN